MIEYYACTVLTDTRPFSNVKGRAWFPLACSAMESIFCQNQASVGERGFNNKKAGSSLKFVWEMKIREQARIIHNAACNYA